MTSNNNKVDTDSAEAPDKGVGCMDGSASSYEERMNARRENGHAWMSWQVRRSVAGRVNQFDLISNGRVIQTCGARQLAKEFRP